MKHAIRFWRRQPLVALAAIASLALGIGANSAIFSVLQGSILRPLPFASPDRLVMVWETATDMPRRAVAPANFVDWQRETRSFDGLAALQPIAVILTGGHEAERLRGASASGELFTMLGVQAALGRTLVAADDEPAAEDVAVLSDGLWRRLFGASPAAIGQRLVLDGRSHLVAGVLPAGFTVPMARSAEVWMNGERGVPRSSPFGRDFGSVRDSHMIYVLGRLAPGAAIAAAQADLTAVMQSLASRFPRTNAGLGAHVEPLHEVVVGRARPLVVLLQAAVALLLVIACANVAHLLLGLATGRRADIAVRLALGADRKNLVWQGLREALVLAVPGGALGLLLAMWGLGVLKHFAPAELPRIDQLGIDGRALAFTLVITVATTVVFGIGPTLSLTRRRAVPSIGAGERTAGSQRANRWHKAIVVVELTLAQMLLVAGGLLLASFAQAQRVDLGFEHRGRIAAELSLSPARYLAPRDPADPDRRIDPAAKLRFVSAVLDRLRREPLVAAAAVAFTAPLDAAPNRGVRVVGEPDPASGLQPAADFQVVSPDFFRVNGIPLLAGRAFIESDNASTAPVAIVNQAFVDEMLSGGNPIGRVLGYGGNRRHEVIGVVANARYRDVEREAEPTFYVPLTQNDERWPFLSFQVSTRAPVNAGTTPRFAGTPDSHSGTAAVMTALRAAIREADPGQPISQVRTYDEIIAVAMARRRFNTFLVTLFAATALLLAAVGSYGVTALSVASRTRELGVRAALGASPAALERMVLGQGAALIGLASGIGLAGAWLGSHWLQSMLFGVTPRDPWTFGGVAVVLALVALAAVWLPARKVRRVEWVKAIGE
jgi:putative ABC transport system permease protein